MSELADLIRDEWDDEEKWPHNPGCNLLHTELAKCVRSAQEHCRISSEADGRPATASGIRSVIASEILHFLLSEGLLAVVTEGAE